MANTTIINKNVAGEYVIDSTNKDYFIDFETAKVQQITLPQLEQTRKENDARTKKPLMGVYHHDFINQCLDICRECGYEPEIYDMFAAHNRDRQTPGVTYDEELAAIHGDHNVKAHTLRRVFTNIHLVGMDTDELTTNLAVSFHQRGIEIGFGQNVIICHNQCLLRPEQYASTFQSHGREKVELEKLGDILRSWLVNAHQAVAEERATIEAMKQIDVPTEKAFEVIGRMNAMRVASDTRIKEIRSAEQYPLNSAQINKFTEGMLLAYRNNPSVSVWDMYNVATDMYKPGQTDLPLLLSQNLQLVDVLRQYFKF